MPARACRGCLATGPTLYSIHHSNLYEMFFEVIGIPKLEPDHLPQKICGMCYAQLTKCISFRNRCRLAQEVLDELKLGKTLTTRFLRQLDRSKLNLVTNLTTVTPSSCDLLIQEEFAGEPLLESYHDPSDGGAIELLDSTSDDDTEHLSQDFQDYITQIFLHDDNSSENIPISKDIQGEEVNKGQVKITRNEVLKILINKICDDPQTAEEFKRKYKMEVEFLTKEQEIHEIKEIMRQSSTKPDTESYFHISEAIHQYMKEGHDESIGSYECKICRCRFSTQQLQRQHFRTHKTRISCKQCDFTTNSFGVAMKHARGHGVNDESVTYRCKYCELVFEKRELLNSHLSKDHTNKLPRCRFCGETALNEKGMRYHMRCHEDVLNSVYKCRKCNLQLVTNTALDNHLTLSCKCFTCMMCGDNFESKSILKKHIRQEHASSKYIQLAECDGCGVKFFGKAPLEKHIKAKLCGSGHPCQTCGWSFKTPQALKDHDRHLHANPYRACESCNKAFDSKNYHQHIARVHNTKPASEKKICNEIKPENRTEPANEEDSERILICEVCGMTFSKHLDLTLHLRGHKSETQYRCDVCFRGFARKESLDAHVLVHTDERSFLCQDCPKRFRSRISLNKHMLCHTGIRSHICLICAKTFSTSTGIITHIKKVHHKIRANAPKTRDQDKMDTQEDSQEYVDSETNIQESVDSGTKKQNYVDSGTNNLGYVGSETNNQSYVDSGINPQGYIVYSGTNSQGFVDSGTSLQGYVDSGTNLQGHVDSGTSLQGYVDSGTNLQGHVDSGTSLQGYVDNGTNKHSNINSETPNRVVKVIPLSELKSQRIQLAQNTNIQIQNCTNSDLIAYNKTSGRITKTIHINRQKKLTDTNITALPSENTAHTLDSEDLAHQSVDKTTHIQNYMYIQNQGNVENNSANQVYIISSDIQTEIDNEAAQTYIINDENTYNYIKKIQNAQIYSENGIQIQDYADGTNVVLETSTFDNQPQMDANNRQEQNIEVDTDCAQVYMITEECIDIDMQDSFPAICDNNDISMAVAPRITKTIHINRKKKESDNNTQENNSSDNHSVGERKLLTRRKIVYIGKAAQRAMINCGQVYYYMDSNGGISNNQFNPQELVDGKKKYVIIGTERLRKK